MGQDQPERVKILASWKMWHWIKLWAWVGYFGDLLTPGKESDGLTPNSTPSLFTSFLKAKAPRGTDHRGLVLGWKAVELFQGSPKGGRPEKVSEV